jgi:hypothetical protein
MLPKLIGCGDEAPNVKRSTSDETSNATEKQNL